MLWVIIPFRARVAQRRLTQLLHNATELQYALSDALGEDGFRMLVVVQSFDRHKFNRGALLNAGVKIARRQGAADGDVVCFHDVDLLPTHVRALQLYRAMHVYADRVVHPGWSWGRYQYYGYAGGIISMPIRVFEDCGGFPNTFFGWGGEDDVLSFRLTKCGHPPSSYIRGGMPGDVAMPDAIACVPMDAWPGKSTKVAARDWWTHLETARMSEVTPDDHVPKKREMIRLAKENLFDVCGLCVFSILHCKTLSWGTMVVVNLADHPMQFGEVRTVESPVAKRAKLTVTE